VTITSFSPLELVQQYFVRLGVRYLAVVDSRGHLKGVIFKKRWLTFLSTLEEHH
jgi:chloride channel 3/4/5